MQLGTLKNNEQLFERYKILGGVPALELEWEVEKVSGNRGDIKMGESGLERF